MSEETKTPEVPAGMPDPTAAIDTVRDTMDKFLETADVTKAFGEPVEAEGHTIIPAAEVVSGMGFGSGYGGDAKGDGGGGGGGGGHSFSRPVAVIIASPGGVRMEPVVDATKIALAFFTTIGFVFGTAMKMKKGRIAD